MLKVSDLNWVGKKMEDQCDSGSVSGRTLASPKSHVKVGFFTHFPLSLFFGSVLFSVFILLMLGVSVEWGEAPSGDRGET